MSGNNCTQVGGALPFSCPIHIENKTHCSLVTAVTLVATGLILFGLSAHLHQGGVLYSGLGSAGALAFTAAGTTAYVGVLITLACQQCRKKSSPMPRASSAEPSPRDSTLSYDSVNGSGSIVVHKGPAKPLVYEIDWSQEPTGSGTGTIIVHPSGSSYHTTLTKTGSGAYRSTQREALAAPLEREAKEVEEGRKETNAAMAQFKETFSLNAQALLASKTSANPSDNPTLDELQLTRLREAKQHIHRLRLREEWGIKRHSSGENIVFEVSGLDGLIFKVSKEQAKDFKEVEEYVRLRQEARQLCRDEGLYMIRIPACSYVEIDGEYVIVEELIEDVYGDYYFQKSLYE